MDELKCPFISALVPVPKQSQPVLTSNIMVEISMGAVTADCIKEQCMFWDEVQNDCLMKLAMETYVTQKAWDDGCECTKSL